MRFTLGLLLSIALACGGLPPPSQPEPQPEPAALTGFPDHPDTPFVVMEDVGDLVTGDDWLAGAVRGPFGTRDDCLLAIYNDSAKNDFYAALQCGDAEWRSGPLAEWSSFELEELLMKDVNGDGYAEAVVMASWMTGIGPDGSIPFLYTSVLTWTGEEMQRLEALEQTLEDKPTVTAVKASLP
ncbi:MAG: hypothetical protein AAFV53_09625 [Myxococcota bacterium]